MMKSNDYLLLISAIRVECKKKKISSRKNYKNNGKINGCGGLKVISYEKKTTKLNFQQSHINTCTSQHHMLYNILNNLLLSFF